MSKPSSSYSEVVKIINQYSKQAEKKDGIILRGYGLYYAGPDKVFDDKIHEIDLSFSVRKNMKYEEARKLYYSLVDGILNEINSRCPGDYFYHFPVGYEDLSFRLSFDYDGEGHLEKDDVNKISIYRNHIIYSIADKDGVTTKLIAKETSLGMGTLTFTGLDSLRTIERKLPEAE